MALVETHSDLCCEHLNDNYKNDQINDFDITWEFGVVLDGIYWDF